MQERIITASVLEDREKIDEEIRHISAKVIRAVDSISNIENAFLEIGSDTRYSYMRIGFYIRAQLEIILDTVLRRCIEKRENMYINVSEENRLVESISIQIAKCVSLDRQRHGKRKIRLRESGKSLDSRNRPIEWAKVLKILNALGLFVRKNGGSHVVVQNEDGGTITTLAPENGKGDGIKLKLLVAHLERGGISREAIVEAMNQVL